jgi:hypothetical protein
VRWGRLFGRIGAALRVDRLVAFVEEAFELNERELGCWAKNSCWAGSKVIDAAYAETKSGLDP